MSADLSSDDDDVSISEPYSQRKEWKDVVPIEQNEGPNDIVRIAYTEHFKDVFSYFRAVLQANEISERAFELTKDAALLNSANYTVWYYRRVLIKALDKNLRDELEFISDVITDNPKNYQVWQHRKNIVNYMQDASDELEFTRKLLKEDSKNYHAWQYRQYMIKTYELWEHELDYIDELINLDVKNNSAWNQRFFYFKNQYDLNLTSCSDVLASELAYCKKKLSILIDNESVWNYLRGMLKYFSSTQAQLESEIYKDLVNFCLSLFNEGKDDLRSPFLLAFLVDNYELELKQLLSNDTANANAEQIQVLYKNAIELLELLSGKYDLIREKYWHFIINKWKNNYASLINNKN